MSLAGSSNPTTTTRWACVGPRSHAARGRAVRVDPEEDGYCAADPRKVASNGGACTTVSISMGHAHGEQSVHAHSRVQHQQSTGKGEHAPSSHLACVPSAPRAPALMKRAGSPPRAHPFWYALFFFPSVLFLLRSASRSRRSDDSDLKCSYKALSENHPRPPTRRRSRVAVHNLVP